MKLCAPEYYRDFKCIADKCTHSCCIGWRIGIDEETLAKYGALPDESSRSLLDKISRDGEGAYVTLCDDGRCPHLTDCGLCRIISELGEEYTSQICREHPRFYNILPCRAEVGLGAVCEEAARIISESDAYSQIIELGECDYDCAETDYDAGGERAVIYEMLSRRNVPYAERLNAIAERYGISPAMRTDLEWRATLAELEYLDEEKRKLFSTYTSAIGAAKCDTELERFLAYLVYRHASVAQSYADLRVRVCFALLLERLAAALIVGGMPVLTAIRTVSEEIEYSENNIADLLFEIECMEI